MAKTGVCSECPNVLDNPLAKTCGPACRARRSRRIRRQQRKQGQLMGDVNAYPPHQKALSASVRKEVDDVLHDVAKEELRPVVREAITEDVLRAASQLVALTPTMVQAITEDLNSSDKILRQKAYTLLAKYTLGNTSIAPQQDHTDQPLQVTFNLPRPGSEPVIATEPEEAVELRQCMECAADKPATEFVGGSERCQTCHDALRERVLTEFA